MRRQVCWVKREEDGTRCEIRVTVSTREVKWQAQPAAAKRWEYRYRPTPEDWDELLQNMENRYRRRTAPYDELLLVRRLQAEAHKG